MSQRAEGTFLPGTGDESEEHFSLAQLRAARANPHVKSNSRTAVRAAPVISPPTWDLALILLLEKV